eukprot:CAMPEP_0201520990 /NCGR_PEP_ID=MMETSP0161_2-20130828/13663_1 /ASSEMBLY_ACC=CAM_ASM_000251 /TAXON_ID=180227 /ORGANISM="Neoparamoeba aestuarina, Strain SoJaBio B1-5/56/2" /LENGTH=119 /DNA_ID=CAMNT_0047919535 /DNA_START=52 /DNA_END=411 /DNA_ORIENTATION=+
MPLGSVGILAFVGVGLAARMSYLRLQGSVGKGDPKSDFEKWHVRQLLHAEWCAIILPTLIAVPLCGIHDKLTNMAIAFVTLGRIGFVIDVPCKARCYSAGVAYLGMFYLSARLALKAFA